MAKKKKGTIPTVSKDEEKLELSFITGGSTNWYKYLVTSLAVSSKAKTYPTL